MKTSESIIKITASFLKAQKKIESVIKDQTNPYFKSKYADLTGVIEACKSKLNAEGIIILQPIDGMNVETILIDLSGEWFSSSTPIVCKEPNNPQALGSAITYAKRYGLQSMVLLPAEDDDGEGASNKATNKVNDPTENWPTEGEHFCQLHKKPMKLRTTAQGGKWYDHRWQDENGEWQTCKGLPVGEK